MNSQRTVLAALALAVLAGCTTPRSTGPGRADEGTWKNRFGALPTDYKPTEPFSPHELSRLAAHPGKNPRRLMWLINRAGAEKDDHFRYLLERTDLRQSPAMVLSLAGYDYSVNGNQAALDSILDTLAREPIGSDADAVLVLAFIDEWDRTTAAIRKHFMQSDGAGSIAKANFWLTREYLFPKRFATYSRRASDGRLIGEPPRIGER